MASELMMTDVSLEAVLDEQQMTLGEVLGLEVGQTMMLNAVPDGDIEVKCSGIPMMRGKIGRMGRYVAIKIDQINRKIQEG
ncbi:FliM/FliN family flagellar motor switch protein [Pseudidiomarina halophila]|uniref:FliM/FliN family flagellar motor switch protein n=1 Tax=Pseudidiomarina halophila TaxID=1449799 RepID=UPI00361823E0